MKVEYVKVCNVPTKVISLRKGVGERPDKLVLIVPGNPGLASYYEDFMVWMSEYLDEDFTIWTISHAGQDVVNIPGHMELPAHKGNESTYDLDGQIRHKIAFIEEYVPATCKLYLIGHSIGCKMILEAMNHFKCHEAKQARIQLVESYFLFPTIERMKASPAGQSAWITTHYIAPLVVFLAWLVSWLPRGLLGKVIKWWMELTSSTSVLTECCQRATVDLINATSIHNVLFLAHTELLQVNDLNVELLKRMGRKIRYYYGTYDKWVPLTYYHDLMQAYPEARAQICNFDLQHAFVLSNSDRMAHIVATWINQDTAASS